MNTPENCVELCAISDRGYYVPTLVLLTSAKLNKNPESNYRIYLILTEGDEFFEKRIMTLSSPDFDIVLMKVEMNEIEQQLDAERRISHISGATMVRCRLPYLLPDVKRLLYLDGDILIRKDLTEFYNKPMEGKLLAGVWSIAAGDYGPHGYRQVPCREYLNAGVLLMNMELMREKGIDKAMVDMVKTLRHTWTDQDVVNAVCADEEKLVLPARYNSMVSRCRNKDRCWTVEQFNAFYETSYQSWEEIEDDAVLLHLAGTAKPWKIVNCVYSDLWMRYYRKSPYGDLDIERGLDLNSPFFRKVVCQWRVFGCLPLLRIETEPDWVRVRLFNFIPLWTVRRRQGTSRHLLFGCLQVARKKEEVFPL